ncbi:MAG: ribonuclease P protein component [Bacteroidales bacterium]
MRFFLRKHNRLSREKDISSLFSNGNSLFVYPIKMIYCVSDLLDDNATFKVMTVVSKRNFKKAVKRNLLKRRLREVFRLNAYRFFDVIPSGKRVDIALVYVSKDIFESKDIEKAELELFEKLKIKLQKL